MGKKESDDDNILNGVEFELIKYHVNNPKIPQYKAYMHIFECEEKSAKSNASKFFKKSIVKKKIREVRLMNSQTLTLSAFWDKNRLIYEYSRLADMALNEGHPIIQQGVHVGDNPDYSAAKGCYDGIAKIIGANEADNEQKAPKVTVTLADHFKKEQLE